MAIKLFVSDLDGTLLNRQHKVSEGNRAAVRKAVEAGTTFTIATGRMYPSALPYAEQLGVDVPIITYNGAVIKSVSGELLFANYLNSRVAREVIAFCQKQNWYIQLYHNDVLYFAEHNKKAQEYEKSAGIMGVAVGDKLIEINELVPKMLVIVDDPSQTDEFVALLKEKFKGQIFATKSNPDYIEIVNPAVNKAAALEVLMKKLNLSRNEVLAIGDSNNDIPMLKYAGTSVAMGNGNETIKTFCSYITTDCDDDGVAAAIEKYVLINK